MLAAHRAHKLLFCSNVKRGLQVMPIGTTVACQTGEHKAEAVQQLGHSAEGTAYAGNAGTLMKGERGWYITYLVHLGAGGLSHPASGIGGKGFQITAGTLCVQHTKGKGGLAGAGDTGYAYYLSKGDIYIYILEVVGFGSTYLDVVGLHLHSGRKFTIIF